MVTPEHHSWLCVITRLDPPPYPAGELAAKITASGFQELPVSVAHTLALERLPLHHRDPFDRILLAQAHVEHLRLLMCDAGLKPYGPVCQVIAEAN